MTDLLVIASILLGYALFSGRLDGTSLTAPMVFVTAGLVLGPAGAGLLSGNVEETGIRLLAEVTLGLVLFTDAVRIDFRTLRREYVFPLRLLAIGMPAGIAFGTVFAMLVFDGLHWWGAALLAAVLIPTDAALGVAVVSDRRLPVRVRQTLNVESGLNDGIALPVVMLLLALTATEEGDIGSASWWAAFAARQIGLGVAVGAAAGLVGGLLIERLGTRGRMTTTYERLAALAVAVIAFTGAELCGGNGFIAAFAAGLAFGAAARERCPQVDEFAEREGELLAMATFTLFGAVVIGPRLGDIGWAEIGYACLSLAVMRPLAVLLAMARSGAALPTVLFFGWFGPRGLASILFALLVVEESGIAEADAILLVTAVTVTLSVYLHGLTAAPLARGLGAYTARLTPTAKEHVPMAEHQVRHRTR
ncbi:cation:proton antiporter [Streptomyces uncialis]|uniref:cation:proton antiporter n=1 Tax=Streptomyces uncialis TaxID=1048205 RepID=UPI0033E27E50